MMDIQEKLKEIGPFVPGADDGMLICRCEEVTKGEIRKAIHEGIVTMEEMRRYLRNGMGLCQISKRNYGKRASRKTDGY